MLKKIISIINALTVISVFYFMMVSQPVEAGNGWWETSWRYRMKLTFDNTASGEELIDFPVLVELDSTYTDFWANIDSGITADDTKDLRFIDSDDLTELYFETEAVNYAGQEALIWVNVPRIDTGSNNDFIYLYYGNAGASQSAYHNSENVWNDGFQMVQHMGDETTSAIEDSTSNNNNGLKGSADNPLEAAGCTGMAQDFSADHVSFGDLGIGNSYTAECWIKADILNGSGDQNTYGFTVMASSILGQGYPLWVTVRGTEIRLWAYESSSGGWRQTTGAGLNTEEDFHIAVTAIRGSETKVYVNGVEKMYFTNDGEVGWCNIFNLGDLRPGRAIYYDGVIDEVRISDTDRSSDWIYAQYLSMTDSFITYGLEEVVTPPAVTTNSATGISNDSARLNGSLDDMGTADNVTVSFEWGMTESYGNETLAQSMNTTGDYFFDIDSLLPGTTYHYRAKATGHGTINGTDESFTTETTAPSISTNNATDITTTEARLCADLTDSGTASTVDVSFQWGTSSGTYSNETISTTINTTGYVYFDISGLNHGTKYYFRAKADGGSNGEDYGNECSFDTLQETKAGFNAENTAGEVPLTVQFQDMSTGDYNSWSWDFGDGSFSTQQSPEHTYYSPGVFTVSLSVSGLGGTDTITETGYIRVLETVMRRGLKPASFLCRHLNISPEQTYVGRPVIISINVVNTGGSRGNYDVNLSINGVTEQSQKVSINAGSSQQVKFTVIKSSPGTYRVNIGGMNGWFNVAGIIIARTPAESDNNVKMSVDSPISTTPPVNITSIDTKTGTVGIIAGSVIGIIVIAGIIWILRLSSHGINRR